MDDQPILVLGMAGTRSLMKTLEKSRVEHPHRKDYIISRHAFNVSTREVEASIAHNQRIEDEADCEVEYYQLLESMRKDGCNVTSFTQGSVYGDKLISRYSGVKVVVGSSAFEGSPYCHNPSAEMTEICQELSDAFSSIFAASEFVLNCFRSTHLREGYFGCFLHDVKVYFAACCMHQMIEQGILICKELYVHGSKVYDYPREDSFKIVEHVVNPDRAADFSREFNQWLALTSSWRLVDYVVTDPGPGYKTSDGQFFISQDADDAVALKLIPGIGHVCISDETSCLTRMLFLISHFNDKIKSIEVFDNASVQQVKSHPVFNTISLRRTSFSHDLLSVLSFSKKLEFDATIFDAQLARCKNASRTDKDSIASMAFVPSQAEIDALCEQANVAEVERAAGKRGPILSKLYRLPGKLGLCPDSLNPNDTVLAGMGAARSVEGASWSAGTGGAIDPSAKGVTVIPDRNMTFGGGSNGPNGVLADCQSKFGPNRINLFYKTRAATRELLETYLTFRDENIMIYFQLFLENLQKDAFVQDFKLDPSKDVTLPEHFRQDYLRVVSLFKKVQGRGKPLDHCGVGCVSFCQTWLRAGQAVGDAQFSVMSPHFQTRFFISDDEGLKSCGVLDEEIASYIKMIERHDSMMAKDYGIVGGGQAFIDLDGLLCELREVA